MNSLLRLFLPIFFAAFFVVAYAGRSYLVWRQTGINPYKLGDTDSAHDFIGLLFRLMMIVTAAALAIYTVSDAAYQYLAPLMWLQYPTVAAVGLVLLIAAFLWVWAAQMQMGKSWRIGIDPNSRTDLVQSGLFAVSRNPIFLGMRALLLGLFLALPNAVTLTIWILGDALMQIQVRLEEEHLAQMHGDVYSDYCRRVRRWI